MAKKDAECGRCQKCRYWFERCCHALAQLEGDDRAPQRCHHFASEAVHLFTRYETLPC